MQYKVLFLTFVKRKKERCNYDKSLCNCAIHRAPETENITTKNTDKRL